MAGALTGDLYLFSLVSLGAAMLALVTLAPDLHAGRLGAPTTPREGRPDDFDGHEAAVRRLSRRARWLIVLALAPYPLTYALRFLREASYMAQGTLPQGIHDVVANAEHHGWFLLIALFVVLAAGEGRNAWNGWPRGWDVDRAASAGGPLCVGAGIAVMAVWLEYKLIDVSRQNLWATLQEHVDQLFTLYAVCLFLWSIIVLRAASQLVNVALAGRA